MMTMTIEGRLAQLSRRIDAPDARARTGAERTPRIQRHLRALRKHEARARAAIGETPEEIDATLAELEVKVEVAGHSLTADAADDRSTLTSAVEQELDSWDAYPERLQTSAATQAGRAREQAEAGIGELRTQRLEATPRLAQLRTGTHDALTQSRTRVTHERLDQTADDLSEKLS
jgi:hypothetical protein